MRKRKSICTILFSNLLLTLTAAFFQPLEHILMNPGEVSFRFADIWWIQLLLAVGAAVILSFLMILLPAKAGRIAASLSLGTGLASLAQGLLFNGGKPMEMNTNWPVQLQNVFVWFGIIAATVSTVTWFSGEQGKRTGIVMCAIAWILITAQAMNFTILSTAAEPYIPRADIEETQVVREADTGWSGAENELISIAAARCLPYLMK